MNNFINGLIRFIIAISAVGLLTVSLKFSYVSNNIGYLLWGGIGSIVLFSMSLDNKN